MPVQPLNAFFIFTTALFTALLLVPKLKNWAIHKGVLDQPGQRKIHTAPMPRLGGVGIFVAFLLAVLIHVKPLEDMRAVLVGGLIIFITGLLDDFQNLSARYKFIGQIGACTLTMTLGDLYITDLGNLLGFGPVSLPLWLAAPFTIFAVVGVINAINLIDGLDGLAGGIALIAVSAFLLLSFTSGNNNGMLLCAALIGALLGFLRYNSYPAKIFMGDAGSMTLGFFLGFLAVMLTQPGHGQLQPVIPVIILGVPILDNLWVLSLRLLKGGSPFRPDKSHVHYQVLNLGFHHRYTVIFIYTVCCVWTVLAVLLQEFPAYLLFYGYLLVNVILYLLLRLLLRNGQLFPLKLKDSQKGLKDSTLFLTLCRYADLTVPAIAVVLTAGFLLAAACATTPNPTIRYSAISLLLGLTLLLIAPKNISQKLSSFFLYLAALLLVFQAELSPPNFVTPFFTGEQLITGSFVLLVLLILLKMIFLKPDEYILSTPLDFLILSLSVSLAVISFGQTIVVYQELTVAKLMICFLALNVVIKAGSWPLQLLHFGSMAALGLLIFLPG